MSATVQLHDDDVPGGSTPTQRLELRKSVVLGVVALGFGVILLVVGLASHRNVLVPVFAIVAGLIILVADYGHKRSRRGQ